MSWVIAVAGFLALIVSHELGHFLAAKAVGMRVERFSLFFPPKLVSFTRGETEYQIGAIPLGGYVKISGMSPDEIAELPPEVAARAYYNKAPWKRIVVILAGPGVNLLLALVLFSVVLMSGSLDGATAIGNLSSQQTVSGTPTTVVAAIDTHSGAYGHVHLGDRIVAIDGRPVTAATLQAALRGLHCAGPLTDGCAATAPLRVTVVRHRQRLTFPVVPHYYASAKRMLMGVELNVGAPYTVVHFGFFHAIGTSVSALWDVGTSTLTD